MTRPHCVPVGNAWRESRAFEYRRRFPRCVEVRRSWRRSAAIRPWRERSARKAQEKSPHFREYAEGQRDLRTCVCPGAMFHRSAFLRAVCSGARTVFSPTFDRTSAIDMRARDRMGPAPLGRPAGLPSREASSPSKTGRPFCAAPSVWRPRPGRDRPIERP